MFGGKVTVNAAVAILLSLSFLALGWHVAQSQRPASMPELVKRLEKMFPECEFKGSPGEINGFKFLLVAPTHAEPENGEWRVPGAITDRPIAEIESLPFEAEYWRGIVAVNTQWKDKKKTPSGWHGDVLTKGPFLFYGDQDMLRKIDKELD